MAESIRNDLLFDLENCSFFGFSIDKCEDIATEENLIFVVKFLKNDHIEER